MEQDTERILDRDDAKEFTKIYNELTASERQQVKSIIIGIQIAKEAAQQTMA